MQSQESIKAVAIAVAGALRPLAESVEGAKAKSKEALEAAGNPDEAKRGRFAIHLDDAWEKLSECESRLATAQNVLGFAREWATKKKQAEVVQTSQSLPEHPRVAPPRHAPATDPGVESEREIREEQENRERGRQNPSDLPL